MNIECAFLSIEDSDTIQVGYKSDKTIIKFSNLVRHSLPDMPPELALEWAAKMETFAHMLREYAESE